MGVLPKNENKIKQMAEILTHLHQYVPQVERENQCFIPGTNDQVTVYEANTHSILLGGDQVSQARARSALKTKANGEKPSQRLEGIIPTIEDWHTKLTLFEVRECIDEITFHIHI